MSHRWSSGEGGRGEGKERRTSGEGGVGPGGALPPCCCLSSIPGKGIDLYHRRGQGRLAVRESFLAWCVMRVKYVLRGTVLNRTYGTHKNLPGTYLVFFYYQYLVLFTMVPRISEPITTYCIGRTFFHPPPTPPPPPPPHPRSRPELLSPAKPRHSRSVRLSGSSDASTPTS